MEPAPDILPAQIASLLRQALTALAGFLIGRGIVGGEWAMPIVGGGLWGCSVAWSLVRNRKWARDLQAAIAAPEGKARP